MLVVFVPCSSLTLYEHSNRGGRQLELTSDDPNLSDNPPGIWNDQTSSLRVTGPCQWILFNDGNYAGSQSVIGPGTRDYEFGSGANGFGLGNDALSSVRCLPADGTEKMVLFQHDFYRGRIAVLSTSTSDLANEGFDDDVTSLIITGGTWQLHSGTNYQGSSVTLGQGRYPTASSISPIANDDLSSVRLIRKFMKGAKLTSCVQASYTVVWI